MAVSLSKPEKVDLTKSDTPPKLREYTPVHLIDEEETIQRPRQPPTPPQQLTKSDRCLKDNEIEVKPDNKELEVERKHHRWLPENLQPLMMLASVIAILTCIFVVVFLLTDRFSSSDNLPVESVPTESVSDMTSSSASAESNSTDIISSAFGDISEIFHSFVRFLQENPLALGMIGISFIFLFISIVRKIMNR